MLNMFITFPDRRSIFPSPPHGTATAGQSKRKGGFVYRYKILLGLFWILVLYLNTYVGMWPIIRRRAFEIHIKFHLLHASIVFAQRALYINMYTIHGLAHFPM